MSGPLLSGANPYTWAIPATASSARLTSLQMFDRGQTRCENDGVPRIQYVREYCLREGGVGNCVRRHEQRHVRDLRSCCRRYARCIATPDPAARSRCIAEFERYQSDDWFECRAWRVTRSCVRRLHRRNCCNDGTPRRRSSVSPSCCSELFSGWSDALEEVRTRCGGWWRGRWWGRPSCPFNRDGSIRAGVTTP